MAGEFCGRCGNALNAAHLFCPSCGASAGDPAVAPGPASPAPVREMDEALLTRIGRIAKSVALLAFLLPWVTVSCAGQKFVSLNGLSLATGSFTARNPSTGVMESHSGSPNLLVLIAALAIAFALFIAFTRSARAGASAGLWSCAAAAALCAFVVLFDVRRQFAAGLQHSRGSDLGQSFDSSLGQMIKIEPAIGFWIVMIALAAACFADWTIRKHGARDNAAIEGLPPAAADDDGGGREG